MLGLLKPVTALLVVMGLALIPGGELLAAQKDKPASAAQAKKVKAKPKAGARAANVPKRATPAAKKAALKPAVPTAKSSAGKTKPVVSASLTDLADRLLDVKSGSALVVDQLGGDALYQKNAGAVVPIASITKLMTAMVVLDATPNLRDGITITDDDVDYLRGSRSRLTVGSVIPRETALLLALMSSENRAAHALARHYPGGMQAFLAAMNAKSRLLDMQDTHFSDPTGLTSNNVSTARDLAKMVAAAYRYPLIREFSTTTEASVEVAGRTLEFHNTNPLVRNNSWAVGLSKTGYIQEAGKCLVMQARVADKQVVIVLLDSAGKMTRVGDANRIRRWMENTHAVARAVPAQARLGGAHAS